MFRPAQTPNQRKIIHIDMDAFYAAIEQRDRPELRGKPIAVGSPSPRGVVATASYEARRYGVRSALPSVTAKRRCPDLIFVAPRFDAYKAASAQIREVFARYTPLIEPLSLDEAYLDVSGDGERPVFASRIAKEIREAIFRETGLTASAGVSYNKFLAKLASDYRKPNGQFVITPRTGPDFIAALPIAKFHGVGPATAQKMERLGIIVGADLRRCSESYLKQHFGKVGSHYYKIARAEDDRPVQPDRERKSIGAETTFTLDLGRQDEALAAMAPLIAKVWRHCRTLGVSGRTITVKLKYSDFRQITRSRTDAFPIESQEALAEKVERLLAPLFPPPLGVRLLGVSVSTLEDGLTRAAEQLALPL